MSYNNVSEKSKAFPAYDGPAKKTTKAALISKRASVGQREQSKTTKRG
jgi:hypothetical protein